MLACCSAKSQDAETEEAIIPAIVPVTSGGVLAEDVPPEDAPVKALPGPIGTERGTLSVKIISARGLRNADYVGKSDPYCELAIPGKTACVQRTPSIRESLNPMWDFEAEVKGFCEGDDLCFRVWDQDVAGKKDALGLITFPYKSFALEGFYGEQRLSDAGKGVVAYLTCAITNAAGLYPTAPAPRDGFAWNIPDNPGWQLDATIPEIMQVTHLYDGTVKARNETVASEKRLREGDFILLVDGDEDPNAVIVKPQHTVRITLEPGGQPLGIHITVSQNEKSLIVRTLEPDSVAAKDGRLRRGDRIVGVTDVGGANLTAKDLIKALSDSKTMKSVVLVIHRPASPPSAGPVDVSTITRIANNDVGMLLQPDQPAAKVAIIQVSDRSHHHGGLDKSGSGHRYDSLVFARGMINAGMSCQLLHYRHDEHEAFMNVCKNFDAVIVRCTSGNVEEDGGDPLKFKQGLTALRKGGVQVWPTPEVVEGLAGKNPLDEVRGGNSREGELRCVMVGGTIACIMLTTRVVEGKPEYSSYFPDDEQFPRYSACARNFLEGDMPKLMPSLGLDEPLPLWWTANFIKISPPEGSAEEEAWAAGDFACDCVSVDSCVAAVCVGGPVERTPDQPSGPCWADLAPQDRAEAEMFGNSMGKTALAILGR